MTMNWVALCGKVVEVLLGAGESGWMWAPRSLFPNPQDTLVFQERVESWVLIFLFYLGVLLGVVLGMLQ